jgi:hypothetical protein
VNLEIEEEEIENEEINIDNLEENDSDEEGIIKKK